MDSNFDKLAHKPHGTIARHSFYIFKFDPSDGSMTLLNVAGDTTDIVNPAFSRFHPHLNVIYVCTEDIEENGEIIAYRIGRDGDLIQLGRVDAGGTSTCYITLDQDTRYLLAVNYWDSMIVTIPLSLKTGNFTGGIVSMHDPKRGKSIVTRARRSGGVNHSNNDARTIAARQADPHSHAIVLDPYKGCIAYVPCLGKSVVREFFYDATQGKIVIDLNYFPCIMASGKPDGPRYLVFHPYYDVMYVVNEFSSTVTVYSVNRHLISEIYDASTSGECIERFKGKSTLTFLQSISTIPNTFPKSKNCCGRICIHKSGHFVFVSNRGHQSITVFQVKEQGDDIGCLSQVGFFLTRGKTPRHFKFDESGTYLIVANQDSDNISIFNFDRSSGKMTYTGFEYSVPSPNFICRCIISEDE
jgi:6-phosphogluconolactonase